MACSSCKTIAASAKSTPCFLTFAAALRGSHSTSSFITRSKYMHNCAYRQPWIGSSRHAQRLRLPSRQNRVLSLPSAVIPHERNFVLNPSHRILRRLTIRRSAAFCFDSQVAHRVRTTCKRLNERGCGAARRQRAENAVKHRVEFFAKVFGEELQDQVAVLLQQLVLVTVAAVRDGIRS